MSHESSQSSVLHVPSLNNFLTHFFERSNTASSEDLNRQREDNAIHYFQAAMESRRVKFVHRPTRRPYVAHIKGYACRSIDSYHSAKKLHLYYLKETEKRRAEGKPIW